MLDTFGRFGLGEFQILFFNKDRFSSGSIKPRAFWIFIGYLLALLFGVSFWMALGWAVYSLFF